MKKKITTSRAFTDKWPPNVSSGGFTQIPNLLLDSQAALGISNAELAVIIQCLKFKWTVSNPYPAVDTVAKIMGQHPDTVRRQFRSLEKKGLVQRIYRTGQTNEYNFMPLMRKLELITHNKHPPDPTQNRREGYADLHTLLSAKRQTKEYAVKKTNKNTQKGLIKVSEIIEGRFTS